MTDQNTTGSHPPHRNKGYRTPAEIAAETRVRLAGRRAMWQTALSSLLAFLMALPVGVVFMLETDQRLPGIIVTGLLWMVLKLLLNWALKKRWPY